MGLITLEGLHELCNALNGEVGFAFAIRLIQE